MLYSRSFLLLAGLPAVLSFGAAPRPGEGFEVTVATESASAQVNEDALQLPSDMCSKLGGDYPITIIGIKDTPSENDWCNTGQPAEAKCNGNRLRIGKSTITILGASTIYDVCQWRKATPATPEKPAKPAKCVLAAVSYICRNDCPGVPHKASAEDGPPPLSDWATDVHIQTVCSKKAEVSAGRWYENPPGSGSYTQHYVTDPKDASCKQKLVRCLPGESFVCNKMSKWSSAKCPKFLGGESAECNENVDKCCWSKDTIFNPPVKGPLKRRLMEDEEELPKPARRRLADGICTEDTTQTVLTNDKGEKSICCVTKEISDGVVLRPTEEWLAENNPEGVGYYKGDPLTTTPTQYAMMETCEVEDNECVCTTREKQRPETPKKCPEVPPVAWGKAKASGRRA